MDAVSAVWPSTVVSRLKSHPPPYDYQKYELSCIVCMGARLVATGTTEQTRSFAQASFSV